MTRASFAIAMAAIVPIVLNGCGIMRVFHHSEPAPAQTTSDVTNPGRPLPPPSPTPSARAGARKSNQTSANARATSKPAAAKPAAAQFPIAKPVPGKPGLVFNPFKPNGGYIDVSGYAPGSKVKDPETQKIFVVPKPE